MLDLRHSHGAGFSKRFNDILSARRLKFLDELSWHKSNNMAKWSKIPM